MSSLEETKQSLQRMQEFDTSTLPRTKKLGETLDFSKAVEPANKLISLYQRLSLTVLEDFPDTTLTTLKNVADSDYSKLKQILDFSTSVDKPGNVRDSLTQQIITTYPNTFNNLSQLISYGVSKATDFQRMENEARARMQSVEDRASELTDKLNKDKKESENILSDIRKTAAEHGVSQQAIYFKEEADKHESDADTWKGNANTLAWVLGAVTILSLGIHKIPWIKPENTYDSIQLFSSKVLLFGVIAYMLILSVKNFLSHKHNSIVNRHRQNALMTFKAITDAAADDESKDIVLTKAAECIFSPQDTGYTKASDGSSSGGNKTIVDLVPRTIKAISTGN